MVQIKIQQGELRGKLETSVQTKNKFISFKGIPYAKPPLGDLRFKAPQPPEKWSGVRDATQHSNVCTQWDLFTSTFHEGSEDCLFLNVYTPSLEKSYPVMVWFHGGAFICGSGDSDLYGPDYLMDQEVVLVTVNYRLEALGFLCLDTKDVPGNAGMKDQVAALKWVRDNISNFGGSPTNVTIFGESAGAVSVTYHLVSPMSKGLFHGAIAQSGCFLNYWGYSTDNLNRAKRLGKYLGKETDDMNELYLFLKDLPKEKLVKVTYAVGTKQEKMRGLPILYRPTVEKQFEGVECFLPKSPLELLKDGHFHQVPVIIGYNDAEGISMIGNKLKKLKLINEDLSRNVPKDIASVVSEKKLQNLGVEIKKFYFGNEQITAENLQAISDLESDITFIYPIIKFAKILSNVSPYPVFLYRFCADGEINVYKKSMGYLNTKGACHADDLFYLFKTMVDIKNNTDECKTMNKFVKMWANFGKYGNPTPVTDNLIEVFWNPLTKNDVNFLNIDFNLELKKNPDNHRFEFWDRIYEDAPKVFASFKSSL